MLMLALIATVIIDVSLVKIYDLIDRNFIPLQSKLILFSLNSSFCLFLQFLIIRYVRGSFQRDRLNRAIKAKVFYTISLFSVCALASLIGYLMIQQLYNGYYSKYISILIIMISYGSAAGLMVWLSSLFLSWYKSTHNLVVFLYFLSIAIIAFNLIVTANFGSLKVADRPNLIREYIGISGDISGGRYVQVENVYKVSSFLSFLSIWITTAILMNSYREKLVNALISWIILSVPFVYFLMAYFYQYTIGGMLVSFAKTDPVTVSILLVAFLALSKPIGGVLFGVVFWNISKITGYEKKIKTYMIISGWGILLIFSSNQAATQLVSPYPPFGLATITILTTAAYLMLLGIYNSATLVSLNTDLRKSIYKHALKSKLLDLIGRAEMEKEIEKTVTLITRDKSNLDKDLEEPVELDETELEKYINFVIKEVKKEGKPLDRPD
jgi:hypothetical protein